MTHGINNLKLINTGFVKYMPNNTARQYVTKSIQRMYDLNSVQRCVHEPLTMVLRPTHVRLM